MSRSMYIDAIHPEEVRVAIVQDGDLKDFESDVASRVITKGNIYLAKVVRVEPSLQAVFVDYGADRHGFLSLNEIHPDYYQLPVDDKEELEEYLAKIKKNATDEKKNQSQEAEPQEIDEIGQGGEGDLADDENDDEEIELDDAYLNKAKAKFYRRYKIQEVIKPRQIILVQVVKEERGNKCAAMTTYISIAGRYCVFMPNSRKGNGISRRINDPQERKRIKTILSELASENIGGVVIRTAGISGNKQDIKRDYESLNRLWGEIRDKTLISNAPCLIHEEDSFIKRTIRDLYSRDIEEILVAGTEVYKQAKQFIKTITPSHAKKVKLYKEQNCSLFNKYGIEEQISTIYQSTVKLKSGGYLVIHPTEALVSIDVNSGRSTRERNIEETAFNTNIEAAIEVARQIRLRDLAGLIVVDFIDMGDKRRNAAIERTIKEALKADRSRVQMTRLSQFGLLEISRQRLCPSVTEGHTSVCPHCHGFGVIRSMGNMTVQLLRSLESNAIKEDVNNITVSVFPDIGIHLLNNNRADIYNIESKNNVHININLDKSVPISEFIIETDSPDKPVKNACDKTANQSKDGANCEQNSADDGVNKKSSRRRRRRKNKNSKNNPSLAENESPINEANDTGNHTDVNEAESVVADEQKFILASNEENSENTPLEKKAKPSRRRRSKKAMNNRSSAGEEAGQSDASTDKRSESKTNDKSDDKELNSIDAKSKDNFIKQNSENLQASNKKGWWKRILE